ncbi:MAG TPA: alpha/beta fold hydrolase [Oscillatoriaceae cyanobacterium]
MADAASLEGSWFGALDLGPFKLRLVLHLAKGADGWRGTVDSPDQGQLGIPLEAVAVDGRHLTATSEKLHGGFDGELGGDRLDGTWQQGPSRIPLVLTRGEAPPIDRPQEPQPPYPYSVAAVRYSNVRDDVTLAGTLTEPHGAGPFPAVLLIPGSGQHDRDCTLFGHKPFKLWADVLTRRGFAVLRVDDRGAGESSGDFARATTADLARDVAAGIAFLETRPEIDPTRIGLMGHSEGGLIAPMVSAESPDVAFLVLLAAPGFPGDAIIVQQVGLLLRASGGAPEKVDEAMELQRRVLAIAKGPSDDATARRELEALLAPPGVDAPTRAQAEGQIRALLSPWYRFFLRTDPRDYLARVRVPVLAINGDKDVQVEAAANLRAIRDTLESHGERHVTTVVLPGLNHLLQTANTGLPQEYGTITETIAPAALELVADWLARTTAR